MSDKGKESGGSARELKPTNPAGGDFLRLRRIKATLEGNSIKRETLEGLEHRPKHQTISNITPLGRLPDIQWVIDTPDPQTAPGPKVGLSLMGVLPEKERKMDLERTRLEGIVRKGLEDKDYADDYTTFESDFNTELRSRIERLSPDERMSAGAWNRTEKELLAELGY